MSALGRKYEHTGRKVTHAEPTSSGVAFATWTLFFLAIMVLVVLMTYAGWAR